MSTEKTSSFSRLIIPNSTTSLRFLDHSTGLMPDGAVLIFGAGFIFDLVSLGMGYSTARMIDRNFEFNDNLNHVGALLSSFLLAYEIASKEFNIFSVRELRRIDSTFKG